MNKKFLLLLCTVLSSMAMNAQKLSVVVNYVTTDGAINNNDIYYQPNQLLTWDDFKGKPVMGSDAVALTDAGFGIKLAVRSDGNTAQMTIAVYCSFSKKDSWVKPGNKTAYILNHEQKHFDIAYIHTFLFMQNLRKAYFTGSNYNAVIEKIYNETTEAMTKTQNEYDTETSHSRIPQKQAEWDQKISKQLALAIKNDNYILHQVN